MWDIQGSLLAFRLLSHSRDFRVVTTLPCHCRVSVRMGWPGVSMPKDRKFYLQLMSQLESTILIADPFLGYTVCVVGRLSNQLTNILLTGAGMDQTLVLRFWIHGLICETGVQWSDSCFYQLLQTIVCCSFYTSLEHGYRPPPPTHFFLFL